MYKRQVQCEMSRSNQFYIMLSLLREGAITFDDLEAVSYTHLNQESRDKIQKVVDWFAADESHNLVYTFHNEKQNKDVYMEIGRAHV